MTKILFVNHKEERCGVQQFGKRIFDLVKNSTENPSFYVELGSLQEFMTTVSWYNPECIIYNWHRGTMLWLTEQAIVSLQSIKHYFMFHEEVTRENYDKYLFFGAYDFSNGTKFGDKKILLPRPLLDYTGNYPKNNIITIGSFGFGFWQKGYHKLVELVNTSFEEAAINLHMPYSFFGDPVHEQTNAVEKECRRMSTNPKVTLSISHSFLDDTEVLKFLAGNDINVFMYGENGEGISSVIDYALSVKRPIAISNSRMFRHIAKDEILLEKNTIQEILARGTSPLESFYTDWSPDKFREEFNRIFLNE
jgi:hypothetical protein